MVTMAWVRRAALVFRVEREEVSVPVLVGRWGLAAGDPDGGLFPKVHAAAV
jgi:hypothetical protein